MKNRIHILGVPLDPISFDDAVRTLQSYAQSTAQHHIMTPNPEMIVEAQKNPDFMALLQTTSLNLPDGAGLLLVARFLGKRIPQMVTGTDIVETLCEQRDIGPIFFLGSAPGIAEKASMTLKAKNPSLSVAGCFSGSPAESDAKDIVNRIHRSGARILFVAFGAPIQDLWIARHLPKMPNITLAMGIGGAFDFIAGERLRAPRWMQSIGLEWLWRLIQEPHRIIRILRAVIVFPLLVLRQRNRPSM